MPTYTGTIFTISRHGNLIMATWEVEGGDDPFAIIDVARGLDAAAINQELEDELEAPSSTQNSDGPPMKDLADISDQRVRQLATDLLAIPGVEAEEDGKAAFAINRGQIILSTAPATDLDMAEQSLLEVLATFFQAIRPPELKGRQYVLTLVDPH
jgi:hypothetical protein